ncbi:hypothetical protein [Arthrobacter sp. MDT1-65]
MNTRFAAIPLALILLAGCAAPEAETEPATEATTGSASASLSATEDAEPAGQVSTATTCSQLDGINKKGVLHRAVDFVNQLEDIDPDTITTAKDIKADIELVSSKADREFKPLLRTLASPMTEMIKITASGGATFNFDSTDFNDAALELANTCVILLESAVVATEPPAPALTEGEQAEQVYLADVRAAQPDLIRFTDDDLITTARNFCLVYSKPGGDPVVDQMITAAAGAKYTLEELQSMNSAGVTALCPEYVALLN